MKFRSLLRNSLDPVHELVPFLIVVFCLHRPEWAMVHEFILNYLVIFLVAVVTVFKDDRKKVKKSLLEKDKKPTVKCYFVHFDSISSEDCILSGKSVSEARSLFMHIHTLETLEKYMARSVLLYFSLYQFRS